MCVFTMCEKLCAENSEEGKIWSLSLLPYGLMEDTRVLPCLVYYGKCYKK